jgi:hypothetical protein
MRRKPDLLGEHEDHALRFAWGVAFIATLALVAILGLARSAQALGPPATVPATAVAAPVAGDEDEVEEEAGEDEDGDFLECDDAEECEEDEGNPEAPPECLLNRAEATVFAAANRDRVRLQLRYTTTSPTSVTFDYGLHGSRGSLFLGSQRKQLGSSGVLRLETSLNEEQMKKVLAARAFVVRLRVPAAPRYYQSLFERQLDLRRALPGGLAWEQSR